MWRRASALFGLVGRAVNHDRPLVSFGSLWLVVATAFSIVWVLGFRFLPAGVLRSGNPVASAPYAGSVTAEFARLFAWNVAVSLVPVAANTFRSIDTPMGYVVTVVRAPIYGAVWGSGSLAIGTGTRVPPSLSAVLGRSGPLEITAMVAIVVATRGIVIWQQATGPRWKTEFERVRSPRDWSLERREWILLVSGYLLLAVANYREAIAIAGA